MTNDEAIKSINTLRESINGVFDFNCRNQCTALDMAVQALEQEPCEDKGEISDGYHTFNQLYHQRAVLFACIVKQNKNKAWKSFKHSDGKYCFDSDGEWFIVGVDTPQGSYTYHYAKEYWDMFDCQELECGKEWDGHTEKDVTRLLSLEQESKEGHWIETAEEYYKAINEKGGGVDENTPYFTDDIACSECLDKFNVIDNETERFISCPNCGAKMVQERSN